MKPPPKFRSRITLKLSRIKWHTASISREASNVFLSQLSLKLNSLSHRLVQITPTQNRLGSLFSCSIHIPPIAITLSLLAMNFSTTYYDDVGTPGQNLRFNALQVAAKLHEVLVVASLSTVAIDYVQYELLRGNGISVGGVITSFQITNIACLWEAGLWGRSLAPSSSICRIRFLLFTMLLIASVAIVSPASAILILPTIGWWEYPLNIGNLITLYPDKPAPVVQVFLASNESTQWPTHIKYENLAPDCTFVNSTTPEHCPAGGLSLLLDQVESGWDKDLDSYDERRDTWNVIVPNPKGLIRLLSGTWLKPSLGLYGG